ncbi:hypothetical protein T492DRAFT_224192 [Pavlovales sp. CCMP2436]|nr:hypothetical protein T492DRAFT_224192 [Pavlovales sp. CCMP2436]
MQREVLEGAGVPMPGTTSAGGAGDLRAAEEMGIADVLASLSPSLRREVLLQHAHDPEFLAGLPPAMQAEAQLLATRVAAAAAAAAPGQGAGPPGGRAGGRAGAAEIPVFFYNSYFNVPRLAARRRTGITRKGHT